MNEGTKRLLRFLANHSDVLVDIMHWDEAEFSALIASMVDTWAEIHHENPIRLSGNIKDMIEDKRNKEAAK